MRTLLLSGCAVALCAVAFAADFRDGWRFRRECGEWQTVMIPHDAAELRSLRAPKVKTFSGMALVVYRRGGKFDGKGE